MKNHAGYEDEIFLENEAEKYYNKKCKYYEKESESYPNYNAEVCKQIRTLIHNTEVYDMAIEIDLNDYLDDYFKKNCKTDRYNLKGQ
uniref:Uncharacterized protein n=1 Tax=Marseillevirus LCMAC101 TaxID=2506602 RepID=A0A481YSD0_9VIRU|nr:MAG: hypothetical protein LCMAC101_04620 [Marseillevirus LCMAC101]